MTRTATTWRRTVIEWTLLIVIIALVVPLVLGLLSGCDAVPKLDRSGQPIPVLDESSKPVLDESGQPVMQTENVPSPEKMNAIGDVASKILPWPWNLIVAGGLGVAATVAVSKRRASQIIANPADSKMWQEPKP